MTTQPTAAAEHTDSALSAKQRILNKADPILLELWEIKKQLNKEAQFDVAQLASQANQFDLQKTLAKLNAPH
jgi:hypothetical protein